MPNTCAGLLVGFITCVGLAGVLVSQPPQVQWSNSANKCVKVESKNPTYTCDNLPTKYTKIYVE